MSRNDHRQTSSGNDDLRQRWLLLWQRLGAAPGGVPDVAPLLAAYEGLDRHYHTLRHIRHCLGELDSAVTLASDLAGVELAIWFHDVVYDASRHDNEERSAELMTRAVCDAALDPSRGAPAHAMILATKHAKPPTDHDEQLMLDIDLSILGRPVEEFDEYERAIRLEYQHIASDVFRAGRAAVLRRFIGRRQIYLTATFRDRYEWAARQNLQRSIERLIAPGAPHDTP